MEGAAFIAALYPSGWPFGGGDYSAVYTWLDPQRTRYGFGYGFPWSSAGLIRALGALCPMLVAFGAGPTLGA